MPSVSYALLAYLLLGFFFAEVMNRIHRKQTDQPIGNRGYFNIVFLWPLVFIIAAIKGR